MPTTTISELARLVYENKAELALDSGFASRIEPAATDKDAFIVAHPGAAEYINDDTKSFVERYSDLMYFAAAVLGIIGSICATLYTKVTRIAPEKASELATQLLDIGEDCQDATCADDLDRMQDELEKILRGVVIGLRDGTISSDGLETFKLGYQFVRDEIAMPAARLGLHYYKSGIQRYVSRLGVDNAKMLFLTAQKIAAPEMLRIGYLTAMVPPQALDAEVDRLANILAGNAPSAMPP